MGEKVKNDVRVKYNHLVNNKIYTFMAVDDSVDRIVI